MKKTKTMSALFIAVVIVGGISTTSYQPSISEAPVRENGLPVEAWKCKTKDAGARD